MNPIHLHFNAWGYPTRPIEVHIKNIGSHEGAQIIQLINNVMSEVQNLTDKVNSLTEKVGQLQTTVDSEQAQVAALIAQRDAMIAQRDAVIAELQAQKAALEEIIANGATPEQLQALGARIDASLTSLTATEEDVKSTAADEPAPGAEA